MEEEGLQAGEEDCKPQPTTTAERSQTRLHCTSMWAKICYRTLSLHALPSLQLKSLKSQASATVSNSPWPGIR